MTSHTVSTYEVFSRKMCMSRSRKLSCYWLFRLIFSAVSWATGNSPQYDLHDAAQTWTFLDKSFRHFRFFGSDKLVIRRRCDTSNHITTNRI